MLMDDIARKQLDPLFTISIKYLNSYKDYALYMNYL
jgi:hypothetical protein